MQEVNKVSESVVDKSQESIPEVKSPFKRNVTFPGESLVAGYLEPPDPWRNVQPWTPADLISSYKASCKRHNTKPINSLLNQLQAIDNVGERYAILSLKGEKLDMKNVETLEEIFKLVQFQCIDLEGTHLDEETSVAIFEMIEYYESACKVNISFNKSISMRGWQSCARMIRKTPCLAFLDARSCEINERLLPILARSLRMGCFLKILHLENTYLSGRSLVILVAALKMNDMLKELFLADNKLMPTDGIQLGSLLKYNHLLELLDLRNNNLQDIGIAHVCDGLYEQNLDQGLNTLVLWNNQMSYQAMAAVSKALTSTRSLETLNIGHNNITNEGIHSLKEGLLQNKSLLRLGLQGTKITCEGAVALAEFIADSPRLLRVDLRENDIKTAGLMALSLALKVNHTIQRIDMDKEMKKETGIKDYIDQQKRLQQDINKKLEENRDKFYKLENQKDVKKEDEELSENISTENEASYLALCETVKRPSMLIMPECSPEMSLDSPHCTDKTCDYNYIPFANPSHGISTPPGELLLSPQYCPSVKARKIFTVSKVDKSSPVPLPGPPIVPAILPPSVDLSMALPHVLPIVPLQPVLVGSSRDIPEAIVAERDVISMVSIPNIQPMTVSDLTNALVDESVNHILNQIICDENAIVKDSFTPGPIETVSDDTAVAGDTTICDDNIMAAGVVSDIEQSNDTKLCDVDTNTVTAGDTDTDVDFNKELAVDAKICDNNVMASDDIRICEDDNITDPVVDKHIEIVCDTEICDDENLAALDLNSDTKICDDDVVTIGKDTNSDHEKTKIIQDVANAKTVDIKDDQKEIEVICMTSDVDQKESECIHNNTSLTVQSNNILSNLDSEGNTDANRCQISDLTNGCEFITNNEYIDPITVLRDTDSGVGSYDCEQWTNVEESVKPNFQTSFTLNGLTQELASAIEGFDISDGKNSAGNFSSHDDFERELDEMLASVKSGSNLLPDLTTKAEVFQDSSIQ